MLAVIILKLHVALQIAFFLKRTFDSGCEIQLIKLL